MFGSPETQPGGRALKFYASQRIDIRRIETLKEGTEAVGNRVRAKIVKNKVAPPFRQAEFDIEYGVGISSEGCLIDLGIEHGIVQKSGAFFSYDGERLGQGRNNAKAFLREHPADGAEIEAQDLRGARDSSAPASRRRRWMRRREPRSPRPETRKRQPKPQEPGRLSAARVRHSIAAFERPRLIRPGARPIHSGVMDRPAGRSKGMNDMLVMPLAAAQPAPIAASRRSTARAATTSMPTWRRCCATRRGRGRHGSGVRACVPQAPELQRPTRKPASVAVRDRAQRRARRAAAAQPARRRCSVSRRADEREPSTSAPSSCGVRPCVQGARGADAARARPGRAQVPRRAHQRRDRPRARRPARRTPARCCTGPSPS